MHRTAHLRWKYWAQHHLSPDVAAALEALRVGRLLDYQEEEDRRNPQELV